MWACLSLGMTILDEHTAVQLLHFLRRRLLCHVETILSGPEVRKTVMG